MISHSEGCKKTQISSKFLTEVNYDLSIFMCLRILILTYGGHRSPWKFLSRNIFQIIWCVSCLTVKHKHNAASKYSKITFSSSTVRPRRASKLQTTRKFSRKTFTFCVTNQSVNLEAPTDGMFGLNSEKVKSASGVFLPWTPSRLRWLWSSLMDVNLEDEIRILKKAVSWIERGVLTGKNKIHRMLLSLTALLLYLYRARKKITQLSVPRHAQLQRHMLKFIKNHLKNSYMFRSSTIFRELQCPR